MRLIVARCEVRYTGRLNAVLPESTRLLMIKSDGSVLVHADAGGYKPLNWMTPPTTIEEADGVIVVRKRAGRTEDCLEIRLVEVLSDVSHEMGEAAGLEKDGVERDLQELIADTAGRARRGAAARAARVADRHRPVDLMCRDPDDGWVAVEVKRIAGIEAVEQLVRYLERIRLDPAGSTAAGVLAATRFRPQAVTLAESRGDALRRGRPGRAPRRARARADALHVSRPRGAPRRAAATPARSAATRRAAPAGSGERH